MTLILQEYRFPLHLEPRVDSIWSVYSRAKTERWDPSRSIPWDHLDPSSWPADVRDAARRVWSHRAWLLFGRLSETPALLVRFCLERQRESDPKYFLSLRGTDEAWHLDVCHRVAEAFGGLVAEPSNPDYAVRFNQTLHREILDAELGLDEYVGAYVAVRETLEAALLAAARAATADPVLAAALDLMLRDKRRHAQFGWLYLEERRALWDAATGDAIVRRTQRMLERFVAGGLMVPGLTPDLAEEVAVAQERTAGHGLGVARLADQRAAVSAALADSQSRLSSLGADAAILKVPGLDDVRVG